MASMSLTHIQMTEELSRYLRAVSLRETDLLRRLRDETAASMPDPGMQIAAEQGQFMGLLASAIGARHARRGEERRAHRAVAARLVEYGRRSGLFEVPDDYRLEVTQTPPPLRVGSEIAFVARFLGRTLRYTYEVVELVPGQRLVMRTAQGPFPMETTYTWTASGSGSTRMTLRNRGEPSGFAKAVTPFMAAAMRRADLGTLAPGSPADARSSKPPALATSVKPISLRSLAPRAPFGPSAQVVMIGRERSANAGSRHESGTSWSAL